MELKKKKNCVIMEFCEGDQVFYIISFASNLCQISSKTLRILIRQFENVTRVNKARCSVLVLVCERHCTSQ